ncbi:AQJ64_40280 family protein [Streptomyces sp. AM 2-1-1]|uniref:AQJ64_40280 family protein n=1 Tax=Streptomyces sp. AM 2-1-1 TaxID=3028709 RepID=UPI0023B8E5DD|nr:AQJ64_40280 family protein [Streptomyces sp. AM 2-1-1]WEH43204.1 amine oxidase [Streptomyces sp. AM 2-1-1]
MAELSTTVTWVDARGRLPRTGVPVAVAITGRYPAGNGDADARGEEFWLVTTAYFTDRHQAEDAVTHRDCFVDSDGVVRFAHAPGGVDGAERVTHWARLPTLPGGAEHFLFGDEVGPALRRAAEARTGN